MNNEKSLIKFYEPLIDKKTLTEKTKKVIELYNSASNFDKERIAIEVIAHSKTLEEALKVGFNGAKLMIDERNSLEEENKKLREIIKKESLSNPKILEELNKMNDIKIIVNQSDEQYLKQIMSFINKANRL